MNEKSKKNGRGMTDFCLAVVSSGGLLGFLMGMITGLKDEASFLSWKLGLVFGTLLVIPFLVLMLALKPRTVREGMVVPLPGFLLGISLWAGANAGTWLIRFLSS